MAALFSVFQTGETYTVYQKVRSCFFLTHWRPTPSEHGTPEQAWDACVLACWRVGDYRGVVEAAEQYWLCRYHALDRQPSRIRRRV